MKKGSSDLYEEHSISHFRKALFSILALSAVLFLIYANSFDCSWHFDDKPNLTENPNLHLKELSWDNFKKTLFSDLRDPKMPYRPVACLSFALNYYFGGLEVFGYHLTNLMIHLITSVFLFLFLYQTLNLPSLRARYASNSYFIALLATVLWAINPVQMQAVTYIIQRMASLAGMFYVMGMYFYLKARRSEKRERGFLFLSMCFTSWILAIGSKENAAMLPVSLVLYETLLIQENPGRFLRRHLKGVGIAFGITLGVGLVYLSLKDETLFSFLKGYEERPFSLTQRLMTEPRIILFYISLLLYPVSDRLSITHTIEISTSLFSPISTLISALLILGMVAFAILKARRYGLFSFCILFFFVNNIIESSIFPLELIFEHRNYLPSMPFFVPIAIGFSYLLEKYAQKRIMKFAVLGFIVFFLIGLGHSTFIRNFAWKNDRTLWLDALEKAPDQLRVHHNLGVYYQEQGYTDEAILEFEKALKSPVIYRKKEKIISYYQLGKLYGDLGDHEKAESYYQDALCIDPDFPQALVNLASVYDRAGNPDLADAYLIRAMKASPGDPFINFNMGLYNLKKNRLEEAIRYFKVSIEEKELRARGLYHLGIAYKQEGHLKRAVVNLEKSIALNPKNVTPRLHLAEVFAMMGQEAESQKEVETIVDLMMQDNALFSQITNLLSGDEQPASLQLSKDILLPKIARALDEKPDIPNAWNRFFEGSIKRKDGDYGIADTYQ